MRSKVNNNTASRMRRKPKLNEINELSMCVFIVKRKEEARLKERINELGGKVVSTMRGIGVSRSSIFQSLKIGTDDVCVCFSLARIEDVKTYMHTIGNEFKLNEAGNGKGFTIDIDGYLGAKALFIE